MILLAAGAGVVLLSLLLWSYLRHEHVPPTLHHVDSDLYRHIIKTKPRFTSPYRLPFWLQNTHIHTLISVFISTPPVTFHREFVTMKDNGVVALDWVMDNVSFLSDDSPVLIILLMWTAKREHASALCKLASERGFRVVVFNKPGYHQKLHTPKITCMGDDADFRECEEYINRKYPHAHLFGHGSSAGNDVLITSATKHRDNCKLSGVVLVSPSFNEARTYSDMPTFYRHILLIKLKLIILKHWKHLRSFINYKKAILSFDFDTYYRHVYCKLYGYEDFTEFKKDYDSLEQMDTILIPVLVITSHDDPICKTNTAPYHLFNDENFPHRMLATVPRAGHCGFFEHGSRLESWSDKLSLDYLEAVLEHIGKKT